MAYKVCFVLNLLALLFNFKIPGGYSSFLITLLFSAVGTSHFYTTKKKISSQNLILLLIGLLVFLLNGLITFSGTFVLAESFLNGWMKLVIIIVIGLYTVDVIKMRQVSVSWLFNTLSVFIFLYCVRFIAGNIDLIYSLDANQNRPNPHWIGGYNQFASILALGIIVIVSFKDSIFKSFFKYLVISIYLFSLLTTMSRGGVYSLIIGLLFYQLFKGWRPLIIFSLGLGLVFFLLHNVESVPVVSSFGDRYFDSMSGGDIVEGTSGRNEIWGYVFTKIEEMGSYNFLFGLGVGSFQYDSYTDPHNTFLHILWEFGLSGFTVALTIAALTFLKVVTQYYRDNIRQTTGLMLIVLGLNLCVEGYQYSTQTGWLLGIFLGIGLAIYHSNVEQDVSYFQTEMVNS